MIIDELVSIAVLLQILSKRSGIIATLEQFSSLAVKAQNIAEHSMERRAQEIAPLGKETIERGPIIFEAAGRRLDAETHIAWLRFDAQLF